MNAVAQGRTALRESKFGLLTVGSIMEMKVQSATKDTGAEMLAWYMMDGFGSVPIVDDQNKLVGIVSEFDLLGTIRQGKKLEDVTAGDVMTANPISVTKDTDVMTLVDVLQGNHLIRVPVLDNVGSLIGIVARRDLLTSYLRASGN